MNRARQLMVFACLTLLVLSIGCSPTRHCGDAVYTVTKLKHAPAGYRQLALTFPEISLTAAGTHRFKVRRLPPTAFTFAVSVEQPGSATDPAQASFAHTTVIISFQNISANVLATEQIELGPSLTRTQILDHSVVFSHRFDVPEVDDLANWDVVITVANPSTRQGDVLQLRGEATGEH